MLTMV